MLDVFLRPIKEVVFLFVVKYVPWWATPNFITLISGLFGVGCAFCCFAQWYKSAIIYWIINRILDGLDGVVARAKGCKSDFGGLFDLYIDFVVYCTIPIGITASGMKIGEPFAGTHLYATITLGIVLTSYMINGVSWMILSAILEGYKVHSANKTFTTVHMPAGLIEGTETIICYVLWLLVLPYSYIYTIHLMVIFSMLVVYTSLQRLYWSYYNLN